AAAIEWLCNAFGFERHWIVPGADGVRYAQLTFGDGMVILGSVHESAFDDFMTQPADIGRTETQVCYLCVADSQSHSARATAAGADILLDVEEGSIGRHGYSCRDPEGHIWNLGTYDPRHRRPVAKAAGRAGLRRLALTLGLLTNATIAISLVGWVCLVKEHPI